MKKKNCLIKLLKCLAANKMFNEIPELGTCSLCGAYTKLTEDGWCNACDEYCEENELNKALSKEE